MPEAPAAATGAEEPAAGTPRPTRAVARRLSFSAALSPMVYGIRPKPKAKTTARDSEERAGARAAAAAAAAAVPAAGLRPPLVPPNAAARGLTAAADTVMDSPAGVAAPAEAVEQRVSNAQLADLRRAKRLSELDPRTRKNLGMQLHRAITENKIPAEWVARHAAAKRDRTGRAQVSMLLAWGTGEIPLDVAASQRVVETCVQSENDDDGWFNYHELCAHLQGTLRKSQRNYVNKVWANAKNKPRRPHPDGGSLPEQRRVFASGRESKKRSREQSTALQLTGQLEAGAAALQLAESLQRPAAVPRPAPEVAASGTAGSSEAAVLEGEAHEAPAACGLPARAAGGGLPPPRAGAGDQGLRDRGHGLGAAHVAHLRRVTREGSFKAFSRPPACERHARAACTFPTPAAACEGHAALQQWGREEGTAAARGGAGSTGRREGALGTQPEKQQDKRRPRGR